MPTLTVAKPRRYFPALALVLATVLLVLVAPLLTPYAPERFDSLSILLPPTWQHPFGTDEFGRDVFSRVLAGARPTLLPALLSAVLAVAAGTLTGLLAGYWGGWRDEAIMRLLDVLISLPGLILAMLVVAMLGGGLTTAVGAIALVFWPRSARLIRSAVVELAGREFVLACRIRQERTGYVILHELLPNLWPIIVVDLALRLAYAILVAASLSYLGLGVRPPTPVWGLMVKEGQQFIQFAPWLVVFPCAAISLVSLLTIVFGEWLRRRLSIHRREIRR